MLCHIQPPTPRRPNQIVVHHLEFRNDTLLIGLGKELYALTHCIPRIVLPAKYTFPSVHLAAFAPGMGDVLQQISVYFRQMNLPETISVPYHNFSIITFANVPFLLFRSALHSTANVHRRIENSYIQTSALCPRSGREVVPNILPPVCTCEQTNRKLPKNNCTVCVCACVQK